MVKKNQKNFIAKIYFFVFLLFAFFYLPVNFVSAALEVHLPGLVDNPTLPQYVIYFFNFFIYAGFTLALISFAVGAVGLIASMDNAESASNAKDRMKGAVLGLVLTLASFIIIHTINPILLTPKLTPLSGVPGVFLTNGTEDKPCTQEWLNTQTIPEGFNSIKYACPGSGGPVGAGEAEGESGLSNNPTLMVWLFPKAGLEVGNGDLSEVKVSEINCDDSPLSVSDYGSFRMAFKTPGVYYCLGKCNEDNSKCSGYMSDANVGSQDSIASLFAGKIKGIRIVNAPDDLQPENDISYGVIFHKEIGLENSGQCSVPIALDAGTTEGCKPVNIDASAVNIFELNQTLGASGDGVTFYSEPYGWDTGARASSYGIADKDIIDIIVAGTNAVPMSNFDHTSTDRPLRYKDICPSFAKCPGSVKIKGNYLVGLYSSVNATGSGGYCQTFSKDIPNLNVQQIIASGSEHINSAYIIPTK